eukprot:scaffold26159_cov124-Isochrysis_galbana.AAC.1
MDAGGADDKVKPYQPLLLRLKVKKGRRKESNRLTVALAPAAAAEGDAKKGSQEYLRCHRLRSASPCRPQAASGGARAGAASHAHTGPQHLPPLPP